MTKEIFTRDEVKALLREALNEGWKDDRAAAAFNWSTTPYKLKKDRERLKKMKSKTKTTEPNSKKTSQQNESIQDNKTYTREEVEAIIRKDRETRKAS